MAGHRNIGSLSAALTTQRSLIKESINVLLFVYHYQPNVYIRQIIAKARQKTIPLVTRQRIGKYHEAADHALGIKSGGLVDKYHL